MATFEQLWKTAQRCSSCQKKKWTTRDGKIMILSIDINERVIHFSVVGYPSEVPFIITKNGIENHSNRLPSDIKKRLYGIARAIRYNLIKNGKIIF